MALVEWVELTERSNETGSLVVAEAHKNIPFAIQRVYYLFGLGPGTRRGFHAHKNLKQVALCIHGSCRFHLDNGVETQEVLLDNPSKGLVIRSLIWREMFDFSDDCVLLVLASEHYDESDYIRDYEKFQNACN